MRKVQISLTPAAFKLLPFLTKHAAPNHLLDLMSLQVIIFLLDVRHT